MPNQAWRLVPIAAALLAAATAVPALADDWDTCAKASGDDAIAACSRAIKSGTYNGKTLALAYSNRGVEWRAKGELARAIADYDEAIKADPQQSAAYNNRGIAYAAGNDFEKAIADYDEAIKLKPDYASALNNRGLAYFNQGQHQRAITDYDEAIKIEPDAVRLNNRGNAYASRGQHDRAIQDFDQAVNLDANYAIAIYNRGNAYFAKGDADRAIHIRSGVDAQSEVPGRAGQPRRRLREESGL